MEWSELLNQLMPHIINALVIIVGAIFGQVGLLAKEFFDDATKRKIAEQTVSYVKQIGDSLGNEEKFDLAKDTFIVRMNEKGIKVTELEIKILIESAVAGFKQSWNGQVQDDAIEPVEEVDLKPEGTI